MYPNEFDRSYRPMDRAISLGEYTAKTFLWMVLGLLVTFLVAVASWVSGLWIIAYRGQLILLIATLVLSFTMARRIESMGVGTAKLIFFAFSALFGLTLSVYLVAYRLFSIFAVFFLTALYFGALAAYGHFTKRDLSGMRTILVSGLIFLIVCAILSWFIPFIPMIDKLICLIGIATFLGFTAYDTQKIKSFYFHYAGYPDMLEKASIFSALQLYLDFLNLFLYLLRFLGNRRN